MTFEKDVVECVFMNSVTQNRSIVFSKTDAIAHVANCFHTMGAGVALAIARQWPEVLETDKNTSYGKRTKLGTFSVSQVSGDYIKHIYNLYGQFEIGGLRALNYEALYKALDKMKNDAVAKGIKSIGIPFKMGCGLAGGNWRIVRVMIEEVFKDTDMLIVINQLA